MTRKLVTRNMLIHKLSFTPKGKKNLENGWFLKITAIYWVLYYTIELTDLTMYIQVCFTYNYLIFAISLWGRYSKQYFIDEKAEAQGVK